MVIYNYQFCAQTNHIYITELGYGYIVTGENVCLTKQKLLDFGPKVEIFYLKTYN